MEFRQLGAHGPVVSSIGLGCMGMSMGYGPGDDAESRRTIQRAIDLGVTLIDTANMYGDGHNETLIGSIVKNQRNRLILATKMGFVQKREGDDLGYGLDGSPAHIRDACDASLRRLGVDHIDIYYLHRVDPATPIEDSIGAMADLVKTGKIRYVGISETKPATIRRAAAVHPIAAVQTEYSLWERYPEDNILPTCAELGIGFVAYSPLGRGFLTGTIQPHALAEGDFRQFLPRFVGEHFIENQKLLVDLKAIAASKNCSMAQLALAWLLAKNKHVVPIPGTKRVAYLEDNLGALQVHLSEEDMTHLERVFHRHSAHGPKYPPIFEKEA